MRIQLFLSLFILITAVGCGDTKKQNNATSNLPHADKFPAFDQFPEQQFKTLELGLTNAETKQRLESMPLALTEHHEVSYFTLLNDSSEIIVPDTPIIDELKVYLHSKIYLNEKKDFYAFLSSASNSIQTDQVFTVFYYNTASTPFKLTYLEENNTIRLHFVKILTNT